MIPVWRWETTSREEHHDLFDEDSDQIEIGAWAIGREISEISEISEILYENRTLKKRVLNILSLEERVQESMAEDMVHGDLTIDIVEG